MRRIIAVALLTASALLAPLAVLGSWARAELLNTDRFVEALAPLATHEEVQALITDQVSDTITNALPIETLIGDLFTGIGGLPLPPRTGAALLQLEPIAVAGLHGLIRDQVEGLVKSPQFGQVWEAALRETHAQAIPMLDGDPDSLLELGDNAVLSLRLGPVVAAARERLIASGITFAERIPDIDRSVEIVTADGLVQLRTVYRIADAAGSWLQFVVAGLAIAGIALASSRTRTLAWTGVGFASTFVLLGGALGAVRGHVLTGRPGLLTEETAALMFDHLTGALSGTIRWLAVASLIVAALAALAPLLARLRTS